MATGTDRRPATPRRDGSRCLQFPGLAGGLALVMTLAWGLAWPADVREPQRHREHAPSHALESSGAVLVRQSQHLLTHDARSGQVSLVVRDRGSGPSALPAGPQRARLEVAGADPFGRPIEMELVPIPSAARASHALFVGRHEALVAADAFGLVVTLSGPTATDTLRFDVDPGSLAEPFVCPHRCEPDRVYAEPRSCPVCGHRLARLTDAHGDHDAKHGGVLFMASDGWHHLEGVIVAPGEFRLYLYNDFTQPIAAGHLLHGVAGHAVSIDDTGRPSGAPVVLSFVAADEGSYLRAELPEDLSAPLAVGLELRFPGRPSAERYDFAFESVPD